jgi:hypothetical protein
MNALCYRLPIAHSPAGDPLTMAAAVRDVQVEASAVGRFPSNTVRVVLVQMHRSIASKILLCSNLEFFRSN